MIITLNAVEIIINKFLDLSLQKFAINEVAQLLWYVFTHATADALRSTALSVSA